MFRPNLQVLYNVNQLEQSGLFLLVLLSSHSTFFCLILRTVLLGFSCIDSVSSYLYYHHWSSNLMLRISRILLFVRFLLLGFILLEQSLRLFLHNLNRHISLSSVPSFFGGLFAQELLCSYQLVLLRFVLLLVFGLRVLFISQCKLIMLIGWMFYISIFIENSLLVVLWFYLS